MTEEQKREYAEAIKAALGMEYGPPMEGEEGWVPTPKAWIDSRRLPIFTAHDPASTPCARIIDRKTLPGGGICLTVVAEPHEVMDAIGATADRLMAEKRAANAQSVIDQIRQDKERRMAEERAKAAEPKPAPPSDDPWAVIGKAEDDGEDIMRETRRFC